MARTGFAALSPRQRDCLRLTAEHKSSKEIARELGMTQKTVDAHIAAAITKLDAANRRHAARLFIEYDNDLPPDKILRQTIQLADSPTISTPFLQQNGCASAVPQAFQEPGYGQPLSPLLKAESPSLRTFLEGVKPDDISPRNRLILIVVGVIIIALALAATVTFIDVLSRLTDQRI